MVGHEIAPPRTQRRSRRAFVIGSLVFVAVVVIGCAPARTEASGGPSAAPSASAAVAAADDAARRYCTDHGGKLVHRVATWNTNGDPSTWLRLAGEADLCEFETGTGDSTTRISVDLTTLSSPEPTLASLAYLSPITTTSPPQVGQNPAAWSCAQDFGGTSAFGDTAAGGGWVDASQPVFVVMNLCVFADGSAIDEFGLWYHANGTVRGADLAPLFAYQPGKRLPAVYSGRR